MTPKRPTRSTPSRLAGTTSRIRRCSPVRLLQQRVVHGADAAGVFVIRVGQMECLREHLACADPLLSGCRPTNGSARTELATKAASSDGSRRRSDSSGCCPRPTISAPRRIANMVERGGQHAEGDRRDHAGRRAAACPPCDATQELRRCVRPAGSSEQGHESRPAAAERLRQAAEHPGRRGAEEQLGRHGAGGPLQSGRCIEREEDQARG